jgi:MFS family permease
MAMRAMPRFGLQRNLLLLFWAMFFTQAAWGAADRFRPLYIEDLGASPAVVGLVIGLAEFIRLICLFIAGPLSDRVAMRLLIGGGRSLIVLGAGVYVVAQEWWHLFPAFVIGALGNVAWPAISKVIAEDTDATNRAHAFLMIYSIAPSAALLAAPLIGGLIAEAISLRAVFAFTAVTLIVASAFFVLVRPTPAPPTSASAASYRDVVRHRPTMVLCCLELLIMFSVWIGLTLAPNYLQDVHGLSLRTIGAFGSLIAIGGIGAGIAASRAPWVRRPLNALLATVAVGPFVFVLLIGGGSTWVFGLAFLLWGVSGIASQLFYALLGDVAPERLRTRAFALLDVMSGIGYMLSGFAAGALYAVSPRAPLWAALVAGLALVAATLGVRRYVLGWQARESEVGIVVTDARL